ncbi:MAG: hypothetical protein RRB22_01115 [Gammaproteobacteria bacterium]|nr:hypothetical protein [Gammaproteobacteria bacterium]
MLMLGAPPQKKDWPEAGISLDLLPLPEDKDQEFIAATMKEVRDDDGKLVNILRDTARYAQLVGNHCIKGWSGVVDAKKKPLKCTEKNIDSFMLIDKASDFVFASVKGLSLHIVNEAEDAKKD